MGKISCIEARRAILIDPRVRDEDLEQHLGCCNACMSFLDRQTGLEEKLLSALKIDIPDGLEARVLLAQRMGQKQKNRVVRRRWIAMAAALVLAVGVSISTSILNRPSLQTLVLEHVHDGHAIVNPASVMTLASVNQLLKSHGVEFSGDVGPVYYAHDCLVGDSLAAHLVMAEGEQMVTILFLDGRDIPEKEEFKDDQYMGVVLPVKNGGLAIVSENASAIKKAEDQLTKVTSYDL